jgi:hypothetical protein
MCMQRVKPLHASSVCQSRIKHGIASTHEPTRSTRRSGRVPPGPAMHSRCAACFHLVLRPSLHALDVANIVASIFKHAKHLLSPARPGVAAVARGIRLNPFCYMRVLPVPQNIMRVLAP